MERERSKVDTKQCGVRTFLIVFCFVLFTAYSFLLSGCKDKVKPGTAEVKRHVVTGVSVTDAGPLQVDEYYETSGTVKAKTASLISGRLMGTVTSFKVKEGDRVTAGQVLMTIDDRDSIQRVTAAEAGYKEALKALEAARQNRSLTDITYQRYKRLFDEKALSRQEIDQIDSQKKIADLEYERVQEMVNRAKAGLSEAQVNHGFTRVAAPVSGIVTDKKIEIGSMAVPGVPMMTVEDTSSFRIEAYIDESLSGKLRTGMPVDVVIDSLGQNVKGAIREIVPAVDPMTRTFLIKVALPGGGLKSGLYAKVKIPFGKKEVIALPKSAIIERGQLTGVYTVDDKNVITYRLVRVGKEYNGNVEILSGINPKDRVITGGIEKAIDGGIVAFK